MPTEPRNLVLAGFMGTGKSTIGKRVAKRAKYAFFDTDKEVERLAGRRIAKIFQASGEASFRSLEAHVCLHASRQRGQVIAVGGGALLDERSLQVLADSGVIVCLIAPVEEVIERIGGGKSRPLASDEKALRKLYRQRAAHYRSLPNQIKTGGKTIAQIVSEVMKLWESQR